LTIGDFPLRLEAAVRLGAAEATEVAVAAEAEEATN